MTKVLKWETREIDVDMSNNRGEHITGTVMAKVLGPLAYHPCVETGIAYSDMWVVTHLPTGLAVVRVKHESHAKKMAEFLLWKAKPAFTQKTKDKVLSKLPHGMPEWIEKCDKQREYLQPS